MSTQDHPQRDLHEELQLYTKSTQLLSNTNLYTRGWRLAKYKVKENTLGDHKDHKQSIENALGDHKQSILVILKDHKQFSRNTKILKIDLRW